MGDPEMYIGEKCVSCNDYTMIMYIQAAKHKPLRVRDKCPLCWGCYVDELNSIWTEEQ
jgi:hypothetical protein